jgi:predicted metal-binding membrane protein
MASGIASLAANPRTWRFRAWKAWHPEYWMLGISAAAWLTMALSMRESLVPGICYSASVGPIDPSLGGFRVSPLSSRLVSEYFAWLLMTMAMMLPLVVLSVRHIAFRSFAWRRNRAVASFLVGYIGVWAIVGAAIVPVVVAARTVDASGGRLALAIGLVLAATWQLSSWKRGALRRCHRTVPLSSTGWRANVDCMRFGVGTGSNCVVSCWALMLTSALASQGIIAMFCFQAIVFDERYELWPRLTALIPIFLISAAMYCSLAFAFA